MKLYIVLICITLSMLPFAAKGDGQRPPRCGDCICPALWAPVCGTDGLTYDNECSLNCKIRTCNIKGLQFAYCGECDKPVPKCPGHN